MRIEIKVHEPYDLVADSGGQTVLTGDGTYKAPNELTVELDPGSALAGERVGRAVLAPRYVGDSLDALAAGQELVVHGEVFPIQSDSQAMQIIASISLITGEEGMTPAAPREGLTSSVVVGLLLSASMIWVAGGDIESLPQERHTNAWLSFVACWLVGGGVGFLIVSSTRRRPARKSSSHYVELWARFLFPIVGLTLLFDQFAPTAVKVPILGFLGGAGTGLLLTSWFVLTQKATKDRGGYV